MRYRRNPIPTNAAGRTRKRRPTIARISPARLEVDGDVGVFVISRELLSENRLRWSHWSHKKRDRDGWEASLKNALIFWLEERSRQVAKVRGQVLGEIVRGEFPRAPEAVYRVEVERVVPRAGHQITDHEDNLAGATKPLVDALVSLGLVYSDRSEWIVRPLPAQRVEPGRKETIVRVSPFWRSRVFEEGTS